MRKILPKAALVTAIALITIGAPAAAQAPLQPENIDGYVEELVVTARYLGPAYWRASEQSALPLATAMMASTPTQQIECFDAAISDVNNRIQTVAPASQAWAKGDTRALLAFTKPSLGRACLLGIGEIQKSRERAYQGSINAIKSALAVPGKALMLDSTQSLVARGGILERLAAEGLSVKTPAD